ncbi:MAG: DUF11 domain-containing protein, partial [Gammaproteobacteria bacterium]
LDYPTMDDAGRIAASIDSTYDMSVPPVITATNLHWVGTAVLTQLSANPGFENNHATMYAPNPREIGSSVSHFSTLFSPTEMMEPAYTRADHNISLANYLLTDIGWGTTNLNTNTTNLSVTITDSEINIIAGNNETYNLIVSNNSATVATEAVLTYMIPAGATFISATPNNATTCFQSNNIVTCHLGNLTMAVPVNIAIVLTLNTVGTNINTAFIDSVNPDIPIANNANTQNTIVEAAPVPPPVAAASSGGGGCFIATAAYGSNMESDVRYLRAFRDEHLLTNSPGRWFVQMYYRYSPSIANTIRDHEILKSTVRVLLSPLVAMSRKSVSQEYLDLQK